ncbi:MAG: VOC family protein [Nitrospiraceae bacterium]|nr:MAG: VOC family protein [Nitrospiraceae bacterium]
MTFEIRRSASYIPVKDMKRAIRFYQRLFGHKVDVKGENLSVFDFGDFKFCLKKTNEEVEEEDSYQLSFEITDWDEFFEKTRMQFNKRNLVPSALVRLERGWSFEAKDSEGNDIKISWRP